MKLLEKAKSGVVRKVVLGVALMGGFLAFLGAGPASARPRVVVGFGGPVLVGGYYAAPAPYWGPAYVGPAYVGPGYVVGPRYRYGYYAPRHRYWDARLRRWR
jgi:hypothetical protein